MPVSRRKARAKLRSLMLRAPRERGHRQVLVEVVGHPGLELAQRLAVGRLRGQLGAELGLAAGALEEEHEPAGRLERDLAAEVLLHQRERQVHAGGHARRGDHVAVAHEDRVGLDVTPGMARASSAQEAQCVVARRPSSRPACASRKAPVQTEVTRRERAAAARAASRPAARPRSAARDARAAGDDQRVDRALQRVEGAVGVERDARGAAAGPAGRHDLDHVAAAAWSWVAVVKTSAGPCTSSVWTPGKGDDDDAAHVRMIRPRRLAARTLTGRFLPRSASGGVKRNVTTSPSLHHVVAALHARSGPARGPRCSRRPRPAPPRT